MRKFTRKEKRWMALGFVLCYGSIFILVALHLGGVL